MATKKSTEETIFMTNYKQNILFRPPTFKSLTFSQKYTLGALYVMYYTCLSPFCFQKITPRHPDRKDFVLKVKTNFFQKITCLIIHLAVLANLCVALYQSFGKEGFLYREKNSMLIAALKIVGIFISGYFFITIWVFQHRFVSLLSCNSLFKNLSELKINSANEKLQNAFAVVSSVLSIAISLVNFLNKYYKLEPNLQFLSKICHIVWKISDFYYVISMDLPDVFFPIIVLSFRDRARLLIAMLKLSRNGQISPNSILREYLMLDEYVNKLNDNFGIWTIAFTLFVIPFYSLNLVVLFQKNLSTSDGLPNLLYLCSTSFFLLMSASLSSQVIKYGYFMYNALLMYDLICINTKLAFVCSDM